MSLSLFTLLSDPLQALIMSMATFMGAVGSFKRIQDFLGTEVHVDSRRKSIELDPALNREEERLSMQSSSSVLTGETQKEKTDLTTVAHNEFKPSYSPAIIVVDGEFGWDKTKEPLLQSINMVVRKGQVTMVIGPVGCGKSTLIKALLGEVPTVRGSIDISSVEIAFCDQTPWHMNGTIQQSIIGMSKLDVVWYSTVICACALDQDLRQLSRGDQTEIGSKGISLSGGQSQRIVS